MLITVKVISSPKSWRINIDIPSAVPADIPRTIVKGTNGLPMPPQDEKDTWSPYCSELCAEPDDTRVFRVWQRIQRGDTSNGAVLEFGGYLNAVLLGRAWKAIADLKQSPVELELHFEPEDTTMQRLPWEMMIEEEEPLGVSSGIIVSVARIVPGDEPKVSRAEIPLRVLFVVGYQPDQSLKPGAELLAIRQISATPAPPVPQPRGGQNPKMPECVDVDLRVLSQATLPELRVVVEEFAPSVVHVVAHGRWDKNQSQILMTDCAEVNGEITTKEQPCTPESLLSNLRRTDGTLPQVVILNACHTGEATYDDSHLPFAAELVRRGISVALGMSGEVIDSACRIFTRALYQSILDLKPLPVAAAHARRAVIATYNKDHRNNVEWSRLTVFRREKASATVAVNRTRQSVAAAAYLYRQPYGQATLCDRLDSIRTYQSYRGVVAEAPCRTALAFEVSDDESMVSNSKLVGKKMQVGKSHLLAEIAAQALFDGIIPCLVPSGDAYPPPANLLGFAIRLAEVADDTRTNFKMDRRIYSKALELAFALTKEQYPAEPRPKEPTVDFKVLRKQVKDKVAAMGPESTQPKVDHDTIVSVIQDDLKTLIADIVRPERVAGVGSSPAPPNAVEPEALFHAALILLDDLHAYEGCAIAILRLLVEGGLAGVEENIGLAFTYSTRQQVGQDILQYMNEKKGAFLRQSLRPFQTPHESRMAYSQWLLLRKPPLAPTWLRSEDDRKRVDIVFSWLHEKIHGIPSYFDQAEEAVKKSEELLVLVPADDETILRQQWTGK
jgi:hypothetical protein